MPYEWQRGKFVAHCHVCRAPAASSSAMRRVCVSSAYTTIRRACHPSENFMRCMFSHGLPCLVDACAVQVKVKDCGDAVQQIVQYIEKS